MTPVGPPSAEDAFASYLVMLDEARAGGGEPPDFEAWVRGYPQFEQELRGLESDWRGFNTLIRSAFEDQSGRLFHHTPHDEPPPEGAVQFSPGRVIGDFRLVQRIGQGDMGEIWEAEQISLRRSRNPSCSTLMRSGSTRSSTRLTSALRRVTSSLSASTSMAITSAPLRASQVESCPYPQPQSRIRLPPDVGIEPDLLEELAQPGGVRWNREVGVLEALLRNATLALPAPLLAPHDSLIVIHGLEGKRKLPRPVAFCLLSECP